ncbi:uncharacterized protein LOC110861806 [Folsomia candida]|uniref:Small ribosomal subunit protein mS40 n=1 Tax=Folsomia candida TaxID=158441 RepID=A0A226EZZ9_FOLCA|nr:uncharacterized protein LOC110861806 [Folsomia candida]OXA63132.1 hypothetical protein Fcan01_03955 [Folsomia candida]
MAFFIAFTRSRVGSCASVALKGILGDGSGAFPRSKSTLSVGNNYQSFLCLGEGGRALSNIQLSSEIQRDFTRRWFHSTSPVLQDEKKEDQKDEKDENVDTTGQVENKTDSQEEGRGRGKNRGYLKSRTKVIPVEVSIRYLKSPAYKTTYGDNLVWVLYRRNFKGQFAPKKTRKTCIRAGELATGNPCPICRDEYLVLHPENVTLLKQFISPFNGEILNYTKTGLCQMQHEKLLIAVKQAKDIGSITFDIPFREYDYSEYAHLYESYKPSKSNS